MSSAKSLSAGRAASLAGAGEPTVFLAGGARIPAIGLGTWPLRGEACAAIVADALSVGYRHLDTAAVYENEEAVGEGIRRSHIPRDEVFVVTKVAPEHIGDGALQESAKASLRRLALAEVDLLLIHWPNSSIPLAESVGALADARARGLTRHVGLSNFDAAQVGDACRLSPAPIVANQCAYNPRLNQDDILTACRTNDVCFVSYSPLARREVLGDPVVLRIAARHRRTPAQIVLRWHLQQGCAAVPRSGDPQRVRENLDVFGFELAGDEMDALTGLSEPANPAGE